MEAQVSSGIPPHWLKPSVSDTEQGGAEYATLGDPHDETHSQGGTLAPLHTEPLAPLQQDTERGSDDDESSDLDYLDGVGSHPDLAPVGNGIISSNMENMGGDDDGFSKIKGVPNSENLWSNEETVALINAVKENYEAIKKKQRNKLQTVWAPHVAARLQGQGYSKSAEQCHVKWKNLLHKFRELKEQSARNRGRFMDPPRLWPYYKMIEEIIGKGLSDRSLSASRFVMYVPPGTKTPNPIYANAGTAIRPYPDVTSTLPTTTPYYYTGVGTGTGAAGIAVVGGAQTGSTITGVAEQAIIDAGGALKRSHNDMMFGGGGVTPGVQSTQLALVSEKLDRVIYLLEKQIELQESLAEIKRQRLDDLGDGGEGLSDTETES